MKTVQIIVKVKKPSLFGRQYDFDVYKDAVLDYSIQDGHLEVHRATHATQETIWYADGQWLKVSITREIE